MKIFRITYLFLLVLVIASCKDSDEMVEPALPRTYRMVLEAAFRNYDGAATRAAQYQFKQGDKVHVLFHQGSDNITGTAVYDASTGAWTIAPSKALTETDDGTCQLAFFIDAGETGSSSVQLSQQTRIYSDLAATYQLIDGSLNVQSTLAPALGRIRFQGAVGQKCRFSGLSTASSFNLKTHTFALTPSTFTDECDADGFTPYYYAAFADPDKRELHFWQSGESNYMKQFGSDVLKPATSGYVSIPTDESHEGWTLVNRDNNEIVAPELATPKATTIRSKSAYVSAEVTSTGGGTLTATGFVISTSHNPTRGNRDLECDVAIAFSTQISGLTPLTTYYVRAYAVNEAGTSYSGELVITTLDKDPGSDIDRDDFDRDENWNDNQGSQADIDRVTWPADENWN